MWEASDYDVLDAQDIHEVIEWAESEGRRRNQRLHDPREGRQGGSPTCLAGRDHPDPRPRRKLRSSASSRSNSALRLEAQSRRPAYWSVLLSDYDRGLPRKPPRGQTPPSISVAPLEASKMY
jgi:hypothetical protein